MNFLQIVFLVMTALVFVMWALSMFRTLFAIRRRAAVRTGKASPGPLDTLTEWGIWLRNAAFRKERRQLLMMTISVIALSVLVAMSLGQRP